MKTAVAVRVIPPYTIEVTFEDGTKRRIDMEDDLWGEVFAPLRDPELFAQAKLGPDFGSVYWPTGADLAPEFLYYGEDGPPPDFYNGSSTWDESEAPPQAPYRRR
jgi:hypothetical protein